MVHVGNVFSNMKSEVMVEGELFQKVDHVCCGFCEGPHDVTIGALARNLAMHREKAHVPKKGCKCLGWNRIPDRFIVR